MKSSSKSPESAATSTIAMKNKHLIALAYVIAALLIANLVYTYDVQRGQQPHHYTDQELEQLIDGM